MINPQSNSVEERARWIRRRNIEKFQAQLDNEHDEDKRKLLRALIEAEEEKQCGRPQYPSRC